MWGLKMVRLESILDTLKGLSTASLLALTLVGCAQDGNKKEVPRDAGLEEAITSQTNGQECFDADNDNYFSNCGERLDCDDSNPHIHPYARELCDNIDNDCDLEIDESLRLGQQCEESNQGCTTYGRFVCDDQKKSFCNAPVPRKPRAEACNNIDDDCDGVVDNVPFSYEIMELDLNGSIADASLAPDGNRIAFTVEKYNEDGFAGFELRIFDLAHRQDHFLFGKLTYEGKDWEPSWISWSPRNDKIAFTGFAQSQAGLLGVASLEGEIQILDHKDTAMEGSFYRPAWSPAGTHIAVGYKNERGLPQLRVYTISDNSFSVVHENDTQLPQFLDYQYEFNYDIIWGSNNKIYLTQLLETYANGWPKQTAIGEMEPNGQSYRQILYASSIQHPVLTALSPDARKIISSLGPGAGPENQDRCPRVYDLDSGQHNIVPPCLEYRDIPHGRVVNTEWFWGHPIEWSADGTRWLGLWRASNWQAHGFIIYTLPCELRSGPSLYYQGE